jgi:superfamily II DNA/RNA helicase
MNENDILPGASAHGVMDVFELHRHLIADYAAYTKSFIRIRDARIRQAVESEITRGLLWPEPLLQLNPAFEPGATIPELVAEGVLHEECGRIFRIKKHDTDFGKPLHLHRHQEQAVRIAAGAHSYVLTTGTGSGKSLSYIIPAVDYVLRNGTGRGIQAIVVYPMNALANSQREELDKFLRRGYEGDEPPVSYARYTGQEGDGERQRILQHPPDILLTNYVMLELILTRIEERQLVNNAANLRFLVFDELHTYRGRQGADVSMLIRRCREAFGSRIVRCVGTSATMASGGTSADQAQVVAAVATKIFGEEVMPENVIGETLRRVSAEFDFTDSAVRAQLTAAITSDAPNSDDFQAFCASPMAAWLESTFGLRREEETGRLLRRLPRPVLGEHGAASELAEITGTTVNQAEAAIERYLFAGGRCQHPETSFPVFAFRLHQFITRGDTAWASLEDEDTRAITLRGQRYVPGDRNRILLPLVFCRSCGQPYYRIDRPRAGQTGPVVPRENFGFTVSDDMESGYLYFSEQYPWTGELDDILSRVPDDWIELHRGTPRIKRNMPVPEVMVLRPDGVQDAAGVQVAFVPAPFRFCLNPDCRVAYNARQRSDLSKLATIGVDGRSTATTVLALATILKLRVDQSLEEEARKLLSFTDNRQDASLQAGHFNDFVEVGLIRSALYRAMSRVGGDGLRYDELVHHVDRAINLPVDLYANDPELRGPALEESRRALRSVLAYFLYRDLERGWRVTSPNLEQCGLLHFDYLGLGEIAADTSFWQQQNAHGALVSASADQRATVIRVLLDHLRRSLAIKEDSLTPNYQDRISEQSRQRLREPWVIEDAREMVHSGIAWPRSRMDKERAEDVCISPQSNFGLFLRRPGILPDLGERLTLDDTGQIIIDLFRCLRPWGLVEEVRTPREGSQLPGYQLPASIMLWKAGDGSHPMIDPLRVTREAELDNEGNQYFVQFYRSFADLGAGLEAREHTAQVHVQDRVERETRFRSADLPILFCSPTMELGVDIAQLNVVNMRNVPPTPANYAQRSGRAGRSGQPALVYTYCSGFSPHDQYYFRNPNRMVSGAVTAPRLDLLNRDLVKAHVHAVWLSEAGMSLGQTLADILVVSEDNLSLPIKADFYEKLNDASIRLRVLQRVTCLLASIGPDLQTASWYRADWLDDVLSRLPQSFDDACHRWRSLYRAAVQQRQLQNRIIGDHSRPQQDRDRAKRLRAQAESQITLLTDPQNAFEGDFYSYRYFASEGFLPGYNFPRLPLSAFIPARRGRRGRDEFLSRPRFLAISEFGPRAMVYHEGARYRIHKVNLAFDEESQDLTQFTMKLCSSCGYGHLITTGSGPDNCENCARPLLPTDEIREMVRLQNVTAKRADRITSDEEERQRIGYEIHNTFRFAEIDGDPDVRKAEVYVNEGKFATLRYGDAATIWRVNLGWRKRRNPNERGFLLDVERGYWATNREADEADQEDPLSSRIKRVVPYVEDRRNALTVEFEVQNDLAVMASLQAALKQGIQQVYQLEPDELAADALPSFDDRRLLFFYESAEGGAGVLRQLVEDPVAISQVAIRALEICHFDPATGEDRAADPANKINCEAACYDCLLDYGNQPDHRNIDRKVILPTLLQLANAATQTSGGPRARLDHLDGLMRLCDSKLERRWLQLVHDSHLRLPSHAQHLISACVTQPDFFYHDVNTAVFVDGPVHDRPEQMAEDEAITNRLTAAGYLVIRFHHAADWNAKFDEYPDIFGRRVQ